MVLMKLDVLSDNELKYIAQQEKIENYSKLSREDLIDNLEEFYDDENNSESDKDVNNQALHRFCKGLVEFENVTQKALPGVQKLPEQYIETSIYLVEKDPFWAYVFWTISPNDKAKLYEDFTNFSIVIRNLIFDGNQIIDKFDIKVTGNDNNWSFALTKFGKRYISQLVAIMGDKQEVLAESLPIETPTFDLNEKIKQIKESKHSALLLSSLVSKDGKIINNRLVQDIFKNLDGSVDTEEEK